MDIRAAPITPSLNLFSTKPPVMTPKATAGRFMIPGWIEKQVQKENDNFCSEDAVTHPKLLQQNIPQFAWRKEFSIKVQRVI